MKPKHYIFSIIDGVTRCILLQLMVDLILSAYSLKFTLHNYLQVGCLFSVLAVIVTIALFCRIQTPKVIWIMSALSFGAFLITNICMLLFPINIFPHREVASAEGFLVLIVLGVFVIFMIVRLAFIVFFSVLKLNKNKHAD